MASIVRILDGEFAPLPCLADGSPERCDECGDLTTCAARLVMGEVRQAVMRTLEELTLEEVLERTRAAAARRRGLVDFSI